MRRHIGLFLGNRIIHSLARVVIATLGVSVVVTLGCGKSPSEPSPAAPFSVLLISPTVGSSGTVVRIAGTGFQSGDTVTVDGRRVDATVLSATSKHREDPEVMKNGRLYDAAALNETYRRQKALESQWWWKLEPPATKRAGS